MKSVRKSAVLLLTATLATMGCMSFPEPADEASWAGDVAAGRDTTAELAGAYAEADKDVDGVQRYRIPLDLAMSKMVANASLLAPGPAPEVIETDDPIERGRALWSGNVLTSTRPGFAACKTCHTLDGTRLIGPSWKGRWGQTVKTSTGDVLFDAAYLKESVTDPMAKISDGYPPIMSPMTLLPEDYADIAAFMETLK